MLGGRQVTRFKQDGEQYDVIVQVAPRDRAAPADISDIYVRGARGEMVQLANLVDVREGVAPQSLNHFNRLRAVTITANLAPATRSARRCDRWTRPRGACSAADRADRPQRPVARVPRCRAARSTSRSCSRSSSSTSCCRRSSRASCDPFVIMLSVPLSMTGALLALWLTGGTLNIYSQIGLVTLVGLITKHGILIVEFANQLQAQGEADLRRGGRVGGAAPAADPDDHRRDGARRGAARAGRGAGAEAASRSAG